MKLPQHWQTFIEAFQDKFEMEIVYDIVRVFQDKEAIEERYTNLKNICPIISQSQMTQVDKLL